MQKVFLTLILSSLVFASCKQSEKKEEAISVTSTSVDVETVTVTPEEKYTSGIEKAHKMNAFMEKDAIQFDIDLNFGGNDRLDAKITLVPNSTKIRIDKKDGSSLIYDGNEVYLSPADANDRGARFDMFTWTYFFALPYKLNDNGTKWSNLEKHSLEDHSYNTARLTFENNIGDAPDDWYVIYTDEKTNMLHAAGYIVTFGGNAVEKAEEEPHAIKYSNYTDVEGIPFATNWGYYNWTVENGFAGKIGDATISNIKFLSPEADFFKKPEDSKIIAL
ncbi:hypothetical protein GTQ40_01950 [Flavobacteriaceae bacterium R38]|nr:hypothetical protein [Flavobacteriaceae bacterium R38]